MTSEPPPGSISAHKVLPFWGPKRSGWDTKNGTASSSQPCLDARVALTIAELISCITGLLVRVCVRACTPTCHCEPRVQRILFGWIPHGVRACGPSPFAVDTFWVGHRALESATSFCRNVCIGDIGSVGNSRAGDSPLPPPPQIVDVMACDK